MLITVWQLNLSKNVPKNFFISKMNGLDLDFRVCVSIFVPAVGAQIAHCGAS